MKLKKSKIIFVSIILLFFFSFLSSFILAAEKELETEYPEIGEEKITKETTLPEYVRYVFKFSLIIAAVAGLAVLIYGGFRYLFSAGSPTAKSEAISWLSGGILGLILLLSSYLILITINPELTILEIPGLGEEYQPGPSTTPSSPEIEKTIHQEIPIGTLVENLLAKNIDCYDYDDEGNMTAPPEGCGCAPGSSGIQGGVEMMENWDRLDCIKRLAEAVRIKVEKLKDLAEKLEAEVNKCKCSNCSCSSCSGEPCPNRGEIDALREEIKKIITGEGVSDPNFLNIREGVKRLRKMRIELQKDLNYLIEAENLMKWGCQYGTPLNLVKFFDLKERREDIDKEDFEDFDIRKYCIEFNCIEWKYEDNPKKKFCLKYELNEKGRLCRATTTQATGQTTTTKEYFVFDGDPASFYCLLEGEISAQDPLQASGEKCLIDAGIENCFEIGQIPIGETVDYTELYIEEIIRNLNIMIVNTEKAANTAYNEESEDDLYDLPPQIECGKCEAVNLSKEVCTLNEDTGEEECECVDCGCRCLECGCCPDCGEECPSSNCGIGGCNSTEGNKGKSSSGSCSSGCTCNGKICASGSCSCTVDCSACKEDDEAFCKCKYNCSCSGVAPFCEPKTKFPAGIKIIQAAYKKIVIANNNIAHLVDVEGKITLCNCPKIAVGFIGGEIEIPEQLNRWKIINAFTNSRNKLEKCIMGYEHVLKPGMSTMTLLNCMVTLDKIALGKLLIVPGFNTLGSRPDELCFEKLAPTSSDVCYPYNSKCFLTDEEINICKQNKDSPKCQEIMKDLMQNFFCCAGGPD